MRSSISYKLRLLAPLLALVTTACVTDSEGDCPPIGQAEQYVLNLRITTQETSSGTTRAEGHGTEEAADAEDRIDIEGKDFMVLVFDGYGRLIQRFMPSNTLIQPITGGSGYEVSGVLGVTSADRIQVAVAANWRGMADSGIYDGFILGHTFLSDMYDDGATWNFTLPDNGWKPDGQYNTIPMYGCSDVAMLKDARKHETIKDRYDLDLGEIKMLRAVAKIEIVDCLNEGLEIDPNITLSNYNAKGRLIPDAKANPDWNVGGKQVATPTLPDAPGRSDGLRFFAGTMTIGGVTRNVYSAYVTEANLTEHRTAVNLTVKDSGENPTSKTYAMAVDKYVKDETTNQSVASNELAALLRNHIYRYEIRSASHTLEINYTVCPWGRGTADIPAFE